MSWKGWLLFLVLLELIIIICCSFELDQDQFVDLCILLGCDYVDKIRGIGPKKAIELVDLYGV